MLRINAVKSKEYLTKGLTKADYYIDGTEPVLGKWQGEMVKVLGLDENVIVSDFEKLYDNISPITGEKITERMKDDRKPFYDFTFSAPKSVSILWATTDSKELRDDITRVMEESVNEAMKFAEKEFTLGREKFMMQVTETDSDGNEHTVDKEVTKYHKTGKLLYTNFLHDTSRPVGGIPDPHLHVHSAVFNMTEVNKLNKQTGQYEKALRAVEFFDHCRFRDMTEAVHHSLLAHKLQELGLELVNTSKSFEIAGFDRDLIEDFSKRTKQIEEYNLENNIKSEKARGNTGSKTREHKDRAKDLSESDLKIIYKDRLGDRGQELVSKLSTYSTISGVVLSPEDKFKFSNEIANSPQSANNELNLESLEVPLVESSVKVGEIISNPKKSYKELRSDKELLKEKAQFALEHSLIHNFERETTVVDYKLMTTALNQNLKDLKLEDVKKQLSEFNKSGELIDGFAKRQKIYTTKTILEEEKAISRLVQRSKNSVPAIAPEFELKKSMSEDQDKVFYSVMQSTDSIKYIKGDAGAGKTYLINNLKEAIEETGREVYAFAPTSIAGRKVLRDEVTEKADTVKMLLLNERLQNKLNDKSVVFVDEAGMIGYQEMQKLLEIRQVRGFELVLVGDTKQHASVARGDALNFMEQKCELTPFALTDNRRQRDNLSYLEAINAFAKKDTDKAVEILDAMGAIKEVQQSTKRYEAMAKEYIQTTKQFKDWEEARKDILIVTPTHGESDIVTNKIRRQLKKENIIGKTDTQYTVLQDKTLSQGEKQDLRNYKKGDVIQFNQNVEGGIKRGSQWEIYFDKKTQTPMMLELNPEPVKVKDEMDSKVLNDQIDKNGIKKVENQRTQTASAELKSDSSHPLIEKTAEIPKPRKMEVPTSEFKNFQVYQKQEIKLAEGDLLRMTNNGLVGEERDKRVYKGGIYAIKKIEAVENEKEKGTQITLENGWKLPLDYAHLKHGYTSTSYSSQGRTVKHLIVAQAEMSNPAASFEQGYVSASRGKTSISLYTDNKEELTKSYKRTKAREFAQNLEAKKEARTPFNQINQAKTKPTPDFRR
jgi:conjugative relaxase-like TrwC/TraI family protein